MSLLKRPPPLSGWGPPQCPAHRAGDTKKCCPLPSVAPRLAAPPRRKRGAGGDWSGAPPLLPLGLRPARQPRAVCEDAPSPQNPGPFCARSPASSSCLRGSCRGDLVSGPLLTFRRPDQGRVAVLWDRVGGGRRWRPRGAGRAGEEVAGA